MRKIIQQPYHVILLPVLFVTNRFFTIAPPDEVSKANDALYWLMNFAGVVGILLCVEALLFFFLRRVTKQSIAAACIVTVTFIPVLFFQDIILVLDSYTDMEVRARWVMLGTVILLVGFYSFFFFKRSTLTITNEYLNFALAALLLYTVVIVVISFRQMKPLRITYEPRDMRMAGIENPDIYFIILDSYTSNQSLRAYFNYDNGDFSRALTGLGFKVMDDSFTEYDKTIFSVASILNLNEIVISDRYNSSDAFRLIKNNSVVRSFEKAGYAVRNFSLFDLHQSPRYYSSIFYQIDNELLNKIFQNTMAKWIWEYFRVQKADAFFSKNSYELHRDILSQLEKESAQRGQAPRFFYAHIMAPHPPYVIDADGNPIEIDRQKNGYDAEAYLSQVKGLNKLLYPSLKTIIQNSAIPPIIIIQGDHGSRIRDSEQEAKSVFQAIMMPHIIGCDSLNRNSYAVFRDLLKP